MKFIYVCILILFSPLQLGAMQCYRLSFNHVVKFSSLQYVDDDCQDVIYNRLMSKCIAYCKNIPLKEIYDVHKVLRSIGLLTDGCKDNRPSSFASTSNDCIIKIDRKNIFDTYDTFADKFSKRALMLAPILSRPHLELLVIVDEEKQTIVLRPVLIKRAVISLRRFIDYLLDIQLRLVYRHHLLIWIDLSRRT